MNSFNSCLIHTAFFLSTLTHTHTHTHTHTQQLWWEIANLWGSLWSWHLSPPSLSLSLPARAGGLQSTPPSEISIHTNLHSLHLLLACGRAAIPPELIPLYIPSGSKRGLPSNCFLIPLSLLSLLYAPLLSSKLHPQPQPPPRSEHGSKREGGKWNRATTRAREREGERRVCHWQGISAIFRVAGGCSPDPEDRDPGTRTAAGRDACFSAFKGINVSACGWTDGWVLSRAACMGTGGRVG